MQSFIFSILLLLFSDDPQSDFRQHLESYLKKQLSSYAGFEYEIISKQPDFKKITAEIAEDVPILIKGDLAYVHIKLDQYSRKTETILNLRLKLYKKILVCINEINKGAKLSPGDFHFVKLDAAQIKGTPLSSAEKMNEFKAKISLSPGTVLIKEIIEPIPVIYPGDKVEAVLEKGNVLLSCEAFSRQEGAKGDIIKIEIPLNGSRKSFRAKIEDFNKVIIIE